MAERLDKFGKVGIINTGIGSRGESLEPKRSLHEDRLLLGAHRGSRRFELACTLSTEAEGSAGRLACSRAIGARAAQHPRRLLGKVPGGNPRPVQRQPQRPDLAPREQGLERLRREDQK